MSCFGRTCSALRQSRVFSEKNSRKLLGRTDIEDVLKRLGSLIQEVQMAVAQILKVASEVKDGILLCRRGTYIVLNARSLGVDSDNMVMDPMWNDIEEVKRDKVTVKRDVEEVKCL